MAYGNDSGMPPVPGSGGNHRQDSDKTARQRRVVTQDASFEDRGAYGYAPVPQYSEPYPEPPRPKGNGGSWKGVVGGAVAGAAVSAALVGVLMGTGVIGASKPARTTSESSAGQTISLSAVGDDTTVAQSVAAKCLPSVVSVYVTTSQTSGLGSGVVLDTEGNIITNWHVVEGAEAISVTIDGQSHDATLVGGDASSDIAVIKAELDGVSVTPMEVGDSSSLVVGDWVMTLGSPLGLDQSASSGIVSALYRNTLMTGTTGNTIYTNLIQVDAAINGGNSGGALVNAEGKLVGINTLYANGAGTESFSGIGFAIPGNYAVEIANKVIKGEQVTHAYIGVSCATVTAQNAQANHLSVNQGAYVAEITEDGPAAAAGIKKGDVVTKIGDHEVTSADGLILAVRSYSVGDEVDVVFVRDGKEQTVKVTLGSDEALQAEQEEQRKKQEEEYQQQLEEYQNYLNQRQDGRGQEQSWPWDSYGWPWEMWDWNNDTLGNPGSYSRR